MLNQRITRITSVVIFSVIIFMRISRRMLKLILICNRERSNSSLYVIVVYQSAGSVAYLCVCYLCESYIRATSL